MTSFTNIDQLRLGNLLQIQFTDGVRNQISQDYRDFEYVMRQKADEVAARELRFMIQTSYGPAAAQYMSPGQANAQFPAAQQSTVSEKTAKFKEIAVTVQLEYNLYDRARTSPKYMAPLALEIQNKSMAAKRLVSRDFHQDGTGVVGTVSSAADDAVNEQVTVTLASSNTSRGHVGSFEYGDLLVAKQASGATRNPTLGSGTFYAYRVKSKIRSASQVVIEPIDSSGNVLDLTSSGLVSTDVFYRIGQFLAADTGLNLSSISDYGTASIVMAGLESLGANDGRTVHGITMSGATAGSRLDANGDQIDTKHIQAALSQGKLAVGPEAYKWKLMSMAPETEDALINGREADRRFISVEDKTRGVRYFAYQHGGDTLESYTTEYVSPQRIWMLPEGSNKQRVIEFHGTDFKTVKGEGMNSFHLVPGSNGYLNAMVSFLKMNGVIIANHPAAIISIGNFSNAV